MKANQILCYFDQNLTRRIGEGSVEKMASKWEEGEDISNLLVKHQVWCQSQKNGAFQRLSCLKAVLRKIRRRMKALMDVTDKYRLSFNSRELADLDVASVGNIFTGLGLLAEVNQLEEDEPGVGVQRLSRF